MSRANYELRAFLSHLDVVDNDICSHRPAGAHYDALQPAFYTAAAMHARGMGAIVTSPPFAALDVALPLLVAAGSAVACVHVPGHYLTSGVAPRFAYLRGLQQQGRLHVVMGLPRGPIGRRCIWLLIFSANASCRPPAARTPASASEDYSSNVCSVVVRRSLCCQCSSALLFCQPRQTVCAPAAVAHPSQLGAPVRPPQLLHLQLYSASAARCPAQPLGGGVDCFVCGPPCMFQFEFLAAKSVQPS